MGWRSLQQLDAVSRTEFITPAAGVSLGAAYNPARPWVPRRLGKIRWRRGWDRGRSIGRFRGVFRVLSGTAQTGGVRRAVFLLGFGILVRLFEDHFFVGAHNLLATDSHGFDTHDFVARGHQVPIA